MSAGGFVSWVQFRPFSSLAGCTKNLHLEGRPRARGKAGSGFRSQHASATRAPRQRPRSRTESRSPPQKKSTPTRRQGGPRLCFPCSGHRAGSVPGLDQEAARKALRPRPKPRPPPQKPAPAAPGRRVPLARRGRDFSSPRKSKIAVLPIDCRQGHLVFELSSPSRVEGWSSTASIRSAGLGICPSLSGLGGPSARRTWIPASTSSDCRYVTECPSLASRIACAKFSVDFRPPSGSRRRNKRGFVHEMNKVVVFQLHSELKQAQNGVTTAKSSVVNRMIESI